MRLSDFNVDALSKSLRLPRETHLWNQKDKKLFRDPGVLTVLPRSLAAAWCKFCGTQLKSAPAPPQSLTILTSQPLSRHNVVQILPTWPSKSAPIMPSFNEFDFQMALSPQPGANLAGSTKKCSGAAAVFNDFDFPTALAPQRGANFADLTFQKCSHHAIFQRVWLPNGLLATAWCKFCGCDFKKSSDHASFWRFWFPNPLFRPIVATSWAAHPSRPPVFGSGLCKPTAATQLWINVAFRAIPTRQNDRVSHVCAVSSLRDHIFCWRIFGGNAQYSRKLDSYISIRPYISFLSVLYDVNLSDVGYVCLWLPACLVYLPFVSPLLKFWFQIEHTCYKWKPHFSSPLEGTVGRELCGQQCHPCDGCVHGGAPQAITVVESSFWCGRWPKISKDHFGAVIQYSSIFIPRPRHFQKTARFFIAGSCCSTAMRWRFKRTLRWRLLIRGKQWWTAKAGHFLLKIFSKCSKIHNCDANVWEFWGMVDIFEKNPWT